MQLQADMRLQLVQLLIQVLEIKRSHWLAALHPHKLVVSSATSYQIMIHPEPSAYIDDSFDPEQWPSSSSFGARSGGALLCFFRLRNIVALLLIVSLSPLAAKQILSAVITDKDFKHSESGVCIKIFSVDCRTCIRLSIANR
jgi:hypothetical protein